MHKAQALCPVSFAIATTPGLTRTNAEQLQLVLRNQVLDDEEKTLSDRGVTAGSHVNAMSKNADIEEAVPPARP